MKLPELSRRFSAESDAVSDEATLRFRSTSIVAPARPKKPEKTQWVETAATAATTTTMKKKEKKKKKVVSGMSEAF